MFTVFKDFRALKGVIQREYKWDSLVLIPSFFASEENEKVGRG